jgi:hypothetical protein
MIAGVIVGVWRARAGGVAIFRSRTLHDDFGIWIADFGLKTPAIFLPFDSKPKTFDVMTRRRCVAKAEIIVTCAAGLIQTILFAWAYRFA